MNLSFKTTHLKRYKEILMLVVKHFHPDMVKQFGVRGLLEEELPETQQHPPEELADDLEKMGPTFVKLGQILSSRADILPKPYLDALARLQDKVKPFSYEEVEEIVVSELGVRISKAFCEFEREPLAAASLGQVHRAKLRSGQLVVVKIQRPAIRKQIAEDLEVLEELTNFFDQHTKVARRYQFRKILEEFQRTLVHELDYQREAANLVTIGANLSEFPTIMVPKPVPDYSTRSVLTMEYVDGKKLPNISPLERLDLNGFALADDLFKAYLKQILVDGIFHADPHPGNVFLTEDRRIALLDLGMVGRTTPEMQEKLIKLLLAISEGQGETAADLAIRMSQTTEFFREEEFKRKISGLVAEQQDQSLEKIDVGRILLEISRAAGENGLYVPVELTLLGKTLLQLDTIGKALDDKFNPHDAIRRHVSDILNQRLQKEMTPRNLISSLLEVKEFFTGLPTRVNKIMDVVGNSELELKIKAPQVHLILEGFQKVANRITTGLILAALIIGAALLMQVQTQFVLFGYPGFAMFCFLLAGGVGFWLVFSILHQDQRTRRKERRQE